MRRALVLAGVALAACGTAAVPGRAQVPGLDRLSGELAALEVDLPGADLASVRGPAGGGVGGAAVGPRRGGGGGGPHRAPPRPPAGAPAAPAGPGGRGS